MKLVEDIGSGDEALFFVNGFLYAFLGLPGKIPQPTDVLEHFEGGGVFDSGLGPALDGSPIAFYCLGYLAKTCGDPPTPYRRFITRKLRVRLKHCESDLSSTRAME